MYCGFTVPNKTGWFDKIISKFEDEGEKTNKSVICQFAKERKYWPTPQLSPTLQLVECTLCRQNVSVLVLGYWLILLKKVSYLVALTNSFFKLAKKKKSLKKH